MKQQATYFTETDGQSVTLETMFMSKNNLDLGSKVD